VDIKRIFKMFATATGGLRDLVLEVSFNMGSYDLPASSSDCLSFPHKLPAPGPWLPCQPLPRYSRGIMNLEIS